VKYLLDVNLLLATIWQNHSRHSDAFSWLDGKAILLCPLAELGFLRISTNKKAINAPMAQTRELLQRFCLERNVERISDDLPPLDSSPTQSEQVTDFYLADLAQKHQAKLATFDEHIKHNAVEVIAKVGR
jgi:predicted nucleic acid-binding protein